MYRTAKRILQKCQDKQIVISQTAAFADANYKTWTLTPGEHDYYNEIFTGDIDGIIGNLKREIAAQPPWTAKIPQIIATRDCILISAEREWELMEAHDVCHAMLSKRKADIAENVEILTRPKAATKQRKRRSEMGNVSNTPHTDTSKKSKSTVRRNKDSQIYCQFLEKYSTQVKDMCSIGAAPRIGITYD